MSEQSKQASARIHEMRLKAGYSQEELAEILHIPTSQVIQYEIDCGSFNLPDILDLADALNISYRYLLDGLEPKRRNEEILIDRISNLKDPAAQQSMYDVIEWISRQNDEDDDETFRNNFIESVPSLFKDPNIAAQVINLINQMKTEGDKK